jgi:hypothetical protein
MLIVVAIALEIFRNIQNKKSETGEASLSLPSFSGKLPPVADHRAGEKLFQGRIVVVAQIEPNGGQPCRSSWRNRCSDRAMSFPSLPV